MPSVRPLTVVIRMFPRRPAVFTLAADHLLKDRRQKHGRVHLTTVRQHRGDLAGYHRSVIKQRSDVINFELGITFRNQFLRKNDGLFLVLKMK